MIQNQALDPDAVKACELAEKILRLADKNPNENERASARAKAAEIMARFNLSLAEVEQNSGGSGKRAAEMLKGGHYQFQRDLWRDVAKLNFCLYFNTTVIQRTPKWRPNAAGTQLVKTFDEKRVREHKLVGRLHNIRAASVQAQYLEAEIERLTRKRLGEEADDKHLYGKWANSYREGMVERVCEKIHDRMHEIEEEDRKREQEARQRAAEQRSEGSSGTSITLHTLRKSEREANLDFLDPDRHAKEAERQRKLAEQRAWLAQQERENREAYTRWAARNPQAAAEQEARRREEARREAKRLERNARRRMNYEPRGYRSIHADEYKGDAGARRAGYEAGESIGIDLQTDTHKPAGALG